MENILVTGHGRIGAYSISEAEVLSCQTSIDISGSRQLSITTTRRLQAGDNLVVRAISGNAEFTVTTARDEWVGDQYRCSCSCISSMEYELSRVRVNPMVIGSATAPATLQQAIRAILPSGISRWGTSYDTSVTTTGIIRIEDYTDAWSAFAQVCDAFRVAITPTIGVTYSGVSATVSSRQATFMAMSNPNAVPKSYVMGTTAYKVTRSTTTDGTAARIGGISGIVSETDEGLPIRVTAGQRDNTSYTVYDRAGTAYLPNIWVKYEDIKEGGSVMTNILSGWVNQRSDLTSPRESITCEVTPKAVLNPRDVVLIAGLAGLGSTLLRGNVARVDRDIKDETAPVRVTLGSSYVFETL